LSAYSASLTHWRAGQEIGFPGFPSASLEEVMKLTQAAVDNLDLGGKSDAIYFDDALPGFGIRIRASGSRSWIYQYKIAGATRRMVIGNGAMKVVEARAVAIKLHSKVKLGDDPAAEKRTKIERSAHTFGSIADAYLAAKQRALRPRSFVEIKRHLEWHAAPLRALPIDVVDQRSIAKHLARIEAAGGPTARNRARSTWSAMYSWAMREGLMAVNPVINTGKSERTELARDRVLTDVELRTLWNALGDNAHDDIVRLLILTGQRAAEVAGLRWSEIDFDAAVIRLPGERTKNHRPHEIPMSEMVQRLLAGRDHVGEFVFGQVKRFGNAKRKTALDNNVHLLPWTYHDLRRTAATRMADIGIAPHVIEAVLNHVSGHKGGVAGIYNRAQYGAEKAQALARWDKHIASVVEGRRSSVTPLRGRV
jgi:integrase